MNISLFEKKYIDHNLLYSDLKQAFEKAKIKIHFPISHQVLDDLSQRMTYIFEGILNAAKTDNLYSTFILYRSFLEHSFKHTLIVNKMVTTLSDEPAENYQKHYFISEYLAVKAGVLEMEDLLNDNLVKTDFLQFLTNKYPEMQGFDKSNQQEISAAIRQFNLREIVKYLHNQNKEVDILQTTNHIFAETLPEYSYVSTFTHGGSYASILMAKFKKQNDIEKELSKIIQISFISTCLAKEHFFMTYEIDKSFEVYINKLRSLRAL